MAKEQGLRRSHFDTDTEFMRICAAFFVIVIHASGIDSRSGILANSVARFSVPVFVMVSGYYMLMKKPVGKRLAVKCCRLFALMLLWSGIYFLYGLLCHRQEWTGVPAFLSYLLTEPVHLWYVYAAIALYILTPLLHVFHSHATQKEYVYALGLSFFFGSWILILVRADVIGILPVILDQMKMPYVLGFVCIYLFGGYLHKYGIGNRSHRLWLYLAGLTGVVATIVGTLLLPKYGMPRDLLLSFFAPNVILPAAAFFVFVQRAFRIHPIRSDKFRAAIHLIAECSMGIYFLHPLILQVLHSAMGPYVLSFHPGIVIPLRVLVTWFLSISIVFLGKKIPVLKQLF